MARYKTTTIGEYEYKAVDESYEDDYGSLVSNMVTYRRKIGDEEWERISSPNFNYYTPQNVPEYVKKCECCGHEELIPVYWSNFMDDGEDDDNREDFVKNEY